MQERPPLEESRLVEMFERLRATGHSLDPRQLADGLSVLREARAAHLSAEECAWLLTPIFAKTPLEQQHVQQMFLAPEAVAGERRADRGGNVEPERRSRILDFIHRHRVSLTLVTAPLIVAAILLLWRETGETSRATEIPASSSASQDVIVSLPTTRAFVNPAYAVWAGLLLMCGPGLVFTWLLILWRRGGTRPLELDERSLDRLDLGSRPIGAPLYSRQGLQNVARRWRQFRRLPTNDLDIEGTISATIRNGGVFSSVMATRPTVPQYLFLIEEQGRHDHVARLIDNIAIGLSNENVALRRYYYDDSLGHLRHQDADGPRFGDIWDLPANGPETLILIGSGEALFAAHSSNLAPHVARALSRWDHRAFLSTRPIPDWADRELTLLNEGFAVGTARESGFAALARHIESGFPKHHLLLEGALAATRPPPAPKLAHSTGRGVETLVADLRARLSAVRSASPASEKQISRAIDLLDKGDISAALKALAARPRTSTSLDFPRLLTAIRAALDQVPAPSPVASMKAETGSARPALRDTEARPYPTPPLRANAVSVIMVIYMAGVVLRDSIALVVKDPLVDELVLVDNGSSASAAAYLRRLDATNPQIKLVQGQGNLGFARGANLGAQVASGKNLVFLQPDALLQPGCIASLIATGSTAASPCIVGACVLNPDGSEQRGGRRGEVTLTTILMTLTGLAPNVRGLRRFEIHREDEPAPHIPIPIQNISDACFYVSRSDFEGLGGLDEGYFLHVEEVDLCWRARERGGSVLFDPHARVVHLGSTSQTHPMLVEFHKGRGLIRYLIKRSGSAWRAIPIWVLSPFIMLAATLRPAFRRLFVSAPTRLATKRDANHWFDEELRSSRARDAADMVQREAGPNRPMAADNEYIRR